MTDDNRGVSEVAADGSPVGVYVALPAEPDLSRVRSVLPVGASILDLGSGPGRIANPLAALGHHVVAVDDSPEMLALIVGAEVELGDVRNLRLGRRFDAVLALSHLINSPTRSQRLDLLRTCHEHVHDDGVVLVQRYPPTWVPAERTSEVGGVGIRLHDLDVDEVRFAAAVTYTLGQRSWTQRFTAAIVDDDELASLAAATDLTVRGIVNRDDAWVLLSPLTHG